MYDSTDLSLLIIFIDLSVKGRLDTLGHVLAERTQPLMSYSSLLLKTWSRLLRVRLSARGIASVANGDVSAAARQSLTSVKRMNSGNTIPVLGLGVYLLEGQDCDRVCSWAIRHGYRHIDTASCYENEVEVGDAVKALSLPREELFVTTKLWTPDHGRRALDACKASLKR